MNLIIIRKAITLMLVADAKLYNSCQGHNNLL
jgi:hypothetical protein